MQLNGAARVSRTDHCSQVERWAGDHTASQDVRSNRQIPRLSPRGQGGRQSKQGRNKSLLAKAGAAWFLVWGLSDNRVGPQEQVLKRSLRNHPIRTHFTDGQTGVQEKEGWVLRRSERIPIQGLAEERFPALIQHIEPTEPQFGK